MVGETRAGERQATEGLHVLAADEDKGALQRTVELLRGLGHDVVGRAVTPAEVEAQIRAEEPDMAVVRVQDDDERAGAHRRDQRGGQPAGDRHRRRPAAALHPLLPRRSQGASRKTL